MLRESYLCSRGTHKVPSSMWFPEGHLNLKVIPTNMINSTTEEQVKMSKN